VNYSALANLFLFLRAISTNLFDMICTISAPSKDRSANTFHSNKFFSGWNCTPKKRKLFGLYSSHKLLILWRGGRSSQGPERLKQSIGIKSIKRNSPIMIKIHNPITLSKLLFLHPSKSSKQIIVIN
jgi:hypothetical protein